MTEIKVFTFRNHHAFCELALTVVDALRLYGYESNYYGFKEDKTPGQFNIAIGGQGSWNEPKDCINVLYETDHVDFYKEIGVENDYHRYIRALHYFDYKKDLKDKNIWYCPIGYSVRFDTDLPRQEDRDYFYFGFIESHRRRFLKKHGLERCHGNSGLWNHDRDNMIVSSKVNIISRKQPNWWFTPLHAALITQKGKLFLQDDCGKDDYHFYKPYLTLFNEDNFEDLFNYWVNHDQERRDYEAFIKDDFQKNHPFHKYFHAAMGDLLEMAK